MIRWYCAKGSLRSNVGSTKPPSMMYPICGCDLGPAPWGRVPASRDTPWVSGVRQSVQESLQRWIGPELAHDGLLGQCHRL